VSAQFGTGAQMSRGHSDIGTELSRPPANIFATLGHTKESFNVILLVIIIKEDQSFYSYTQEYTTDN